MPQRNYSTTLKQIFVNGGHPTPTFLRSAAHPQSALSFRTNIKRQLGHLVAHPREFICSPLKRTPASTIWDVRFYGSRLRLRTNISNPSMFRAPNRGLFVFDSLCKAEGVQKMQRTWEDKNSVDRRLFEMMLKSSEHVLSSQDACPGAVMRPSPDFASSTASCKTCSASSVFACKPSYKICGDADAEFKPNVRPNRTTNQSRRSVAILREMRILKGYFVGGAEAELGPKEAGRRKQAEEENGKSKTKQQVLASPSVGGRIVIGSKKEATRTALRGHKIEHQYHALHCLYVRKISNEFSGNATSVFGFLRRLYSLSTSFENLRETALWEARQHQRKLIVPPLRQTLWGERRLGWGGEASPKNPKLNANANNSMTNAQFGVDVESVGLARGPAHLPGLLGGRAGPAAKPPQKKEAKKENTQNFSLLAPRHQDQDLIDPLLAAFFQKAATLSKTERQGNAQMESRPSSDCEKGRASLTLPVRERQGGGVPLRGTQLYLISNWKPGPEGSSLHISNSVPFSFKEGRQINQRELDASDGGSIKSKTCLPPEGGHESTRSFDLEAHLFLMLLSVNLRFVLLLPSPFYFSPLRLRLRLRSAVSAPASQEPRAVGLSSWGLPPEGGRGFAAAGEKNTSCFALLMPERKPWYKPSTSAFFYLYPSAILSISSLIVETSDVYDSHLVHDSTNHKQTQASKGPPSEEPRLPSAFYASLQDVETTVALAIWAAGGFAAGKHIHRRSVDWIFHTGHVYASIFYLRCYWLYLYNHFFASFREPSASLSTSRAGCAEPGRIIAAQERASLNTTPSNWKPEAGRQRIGEVQQPDRHVLTPAMATITNTQGSNKILSSNLSAQRFKSRYYSSGRWICGGEPLPFSFSSSSLAALITTPAKEKTGGVRNAPAENQMPCFSDFFVQGSLGGGASIWGPKRGTLPGRRGTQDGGLTRSLSSRGSLRISRRQQRGDFALLGPSCPQIGEHRALLRTDVTLSSVPNLIGLSF